MSLRMLSMSSKHIMRLANGLLPQEASFRWAIQFKAYWAQSSMEPVNKVNWLGGCSSRRVRKSSGHVRNWQSGNYCAYAIHILVNNKRKKNNSSICFTYAIHMRNKIVKYMVYYKQNI